MTKRDKSSDAVFGAGGGDTQFSIFGLIWNAATSNLIVSLPIIVLGGAFFNWRNDKGQKSFDLLIYSLQAFVVIMFWVVFWQFRNEEKKRQFSIRRIILIEKLRERKAKVFYQLDWIRSHHNILSMTHKNIIVQTAEILEQPTHAKITPQTLKAIGKTLRRVTDAIYSNLDDIALDFKIFKKKWYEQDDFAIIPELDLETLSHTKALEQLLEEADQL